MVMTLLIILGCWAILTGIACMAPCRERGYVTLGDFIFCLCLAPYIGFMELAYIVYRWIQVSPFFDKKLFSCQK